MTTHPNTPQENEPAQIGDIITDGLETGRVSGTARIKADSPLFYVVDIAPGKRTVIQADHAKVIVRRDP